MHSGRVAATMIRAINIDISSAVVAASTAAGDNGVEQGAIIPTCPCAAHALEHYATHQYLFEQAGARHIRHARRQLCR